ncbi:TonB-dependent receptor [Mariniflexile litorale]|uniref:TonB-dependent receptor n=1 Tax=Mariniflexile litorale TaxID=3045158 RepID=A0AAU7EJW4_9FLAO|nr:TonB-dependent receptor [Mariniflexile sp. KMM 9835]MDQ8210200.1 TonB-dependent receptor [Mariniflexile sp. KMM 9835]
MKKNIIYNLFLVGTLLFGGTLFAQTIKGTVSDINGPLPGVNVIIKGTSRGTATDFDGNYTIKSVDSDVILVFSMIGYINKEVSINGQSQINVVLTEDLKTLDEIVLVGYSSRKKSTLTGAVSVVDMGDLEKTRVVNVTQALQGQIAGVQVTSSTGAPGDAIEVRIRGLGTIGDNNPLYVIDGIPTRDIGFLNQADIKSMTVLKDASAAAIYGSRASGGVVLITTKSGKEGKISFDMSYYTGLHFASNLSDMLNAEQYMNTVEKAWNNSDRTGINPYTADKGRADFSDTDWLDELFETGKSQNLQFTASGGSDKVQFLMSLGYYGQDGIVIFDNDKYKRLSYRTNLNVNLTDRFKIGTNLQLTYATQDAISSKGDEPGIIRHALLRAPVIGVYKDVNDPTYSQRDPFTDLPFYLHNDRDSGGWESDKYEWSSNPIALAYFTDDVRKDFRTFGNIYTEYSFLKDKELTFRTNVGVDLSFIHNKTFGENFGDDDGGGNATDQGLGRQNRPNNLSEERGEVRTITFNNTLNYAKTFNEKHDISALLGMEYIDNYSSSIGASRARFDNTDSTFRYIDYGATETDLWNGGSASEWALFSYFGSASYMFDSKYMVTANMRADASSRFSENNRWGYFPSISAGWKISDEDFLKDVKWLSNFKLRAGWGKLGNQEIDNYAFLTLISQIDGKVVVNRYGNEDLKWESSESTNIGFDAGFLNNKLTFSAEYYVKNTSDILLPIGLPSIVGDVAPTIVNAGEVSNKGFEFSLNYRESSNEFKYSLNANIGTVVNSVEKLHPNVPNLVGQVTRTQVGQPLNAYYGYKMVGIYQNQAEINTHLSGTLNPSVKPGDIKFEDINDDGIINSDDRKFLGSSIPDLTYGISFSSSYKNFDFSFLFQGVEGVDRYNDSKKILDYDTRPFNYTTNILGAWDGEGTSNTIPRVAFEDNGSSKVSSIFVEDASYLRLKNVELGYTLNGVKGVQDIRLYVSGQNLFTATKYTGMDPESTDLIDKGTYPSSSSILFGLNVKF